MALSEAPENVLLLPSRLTSVHPDVRQFLLNAAIHIHNENPVAMARWGYVSPVNRPPVPGYESAPGVPLNDAGEVK